MRDIRRSRQAGGLGTPPVPVDAPNRETASAARHRLATRAHLNWHPTERCGRVTLAPSRSIVRPSTCRALCHLATGLGRENEEVLSMIRVLVKQGRGLFVVVALLAIAVAACSSGGSSATGSNAPGNGGTNQPGGGGGSGFASGLSTNLNTLDSYKFSWSVMGTDSSSPSDTGSGGAITGTVINKPTKASLVNYFGGAVDRKSTRRTP